MDNSMLTVFCPMCGEENVTANVVKAGIYKLEPHWDMQQYGVCPSAELEYKQEKLRPQ